MIFAPLEQFQILSLINLNFFGFDFSITNFFIINFLSLIIIFLINFCNTDKNITFYYIANSWQKLFEIVLSIVSQLICDIITNENEKYLPFILLIKFYISLKYRVYYLNFLLFP